jgi:hypothetical protein
MNTSSRRLLSGLAAAVVLALAVGGYARAADPSPTVGPVPSGPTGNEMLSVQPSIVSVSVKPGATTSSQLTIRAAADLSVTIKSQGLAQGTDGSFKSVPDAQDTSAYSARTMVTASKQSLDLHPGDKVDLTVNVAVPADVGDGTRYAILTITGLPAGASPSSNVGFGVELGVSVIVQIAGTPQNKTGTIQTIGVGQTLPGAPLPVTASFLNTGNTHYGATPDELVTTATLQDSSGTQLASANASGNNLSIIPTFTRDIALPMTPSKPMVDGAKYHIEVGVGLKDGAVLDRKALDFTWSGGQAVSGTPSTPAPTSNDTGIIILGAALGAAAVALILVVLPRLLRRRRPSGSPS